MIHGFCCIKMSNICNSIEIKNLSHILAAIDKF